MIAKRRTETTETNTVCGAEIDLCRRRLFWFLVIGISVIVDDVMLVVVAAAAAMIFVQLLSEV
jgi:hypothetical protein